jgi:spore germination protein GerM
VSAVRLRVVAAALLGTLLVAGCGVPDQPNPTQIAARKVPFGLVEGKHGSTNEAARGVVTLYLPGPSGLVEVKRPIADAVTPSGALRALLAGPLPAERRRGTGSAPMEPEDARFDGVQRGVARVALDRGFESMAIGEQPTALAGIVYTLTAFRSIDAVSFFVDGQRVDVPRADGSLANGPVRRVDYAQLVTRAGP